VRFKTLRDIDRAGCDLRLWCYHCQRDGIVDGIVWTHFEERGLPLEIDAARRFFPCKTCGARDCLIVPTRARGWRPKNATSVGVAWFFANRSAGKRRK